MHWQEMVLSVNWSHASRSYVKISYSPQLSEKYKQNFKIIIFCSYMYQFLKFNQQEARVFFKTTCIKFSYFRLISINSLREIFVYIECRKTTKLKNKYRAVCRDTIALLQCMNPVFMSKFSCCTNFYKNLENDT